MQVQSQALQLVTKAQQLVAKLASGSNGITTEAAEVDAHTCVHVPQVGVFLHASEFWTWPLCSLCSASVTSFFFFFF